MAGGIYEIRNVQTGVRYIGSAVRISVRLKQHKATLVRGRHHSIALQRAWDKYGESVFVMQPVVILEDSELLSTEQRFLDAEHSGETYNIAKFAVSPMKGRKHSAETLSRMSASRMGNKSRTGVPAHWSKDMPPPSLQKLIDASKNPSLETRAKMREAKLGVVPVNKGLRQSLCKRGHEMAGANVYHRPDGRSPSCKACLKINALERK